MNNSTIWQTATDSVERSMWYSVENSVYDYFEQNSLTTQDLELL